MTSPDFLTPDDAEFLRANGHDWACEDENGKQCLIIRNYLLPAGYTPETADLMLLIPANYPAGMIDMFYFAPSVFRADGIGIGALLDEIHLGRIWQRWSRHYTWLAGRDNVATHICFVGNQLKSELESNQ